jgi:hypothetical protein
LKNIALASKNSEVRYTWFVTSKELIRCLLQELVEVKTISGMTCRINRLHPKLIRGLVFIKHGSCHLYENSVLSFDHPILLRCGGQKLMLDAFIKEVFYLSVLELGPLSLLIFLTLASNSFYTLLKNFFSTSCVFHHCLIKRTPK